MVIGQSYWTPASRGWVRARSSDPREKPAVQLNLLSERADVDAMIRAIRRWLEIAATEPLASVADAEIHPGEAVQSDAELEAWLRRTCEHTYHPSCTARMGEPGEGVLDAQLRVHGVAGLRVADASALPAIKHANTNAPSILMGERVADFLRAGAAEQNRTAAGGIAV
jgi:choline dehydrogenase